MVTISRALLSVYDKTGIVDFARELASMGVQLISTGGTARVLRVAGLTVTDVSEITGFPEMMEGRVKTLHPAIHGGLLARLDKELHVRAMQEHAIQSIDLVVINLYPFEETLRTPGATHNQIIEQIDIGGPAMLRSAAKNYDFTAVVTDPELYTEILTELRENSMTLSENRRRTLAHQVFKLTSQYDSVIAEYFAGVALGSNASDPSAHPDHFMLGLPLDQGLRYGENPQQQGALYGRFTSLFRQLHGKELSYNNILDIDAAAKLALEFEEPTVVIVKHSNPCGVGSAETLADAWHKAFATDTQSPFGGIIAVNRELDITAAMLIDEIFTEVVIAPSYTDGALELLCKKKNRRLIQANFDELTTAVREQQIRSVAGGILVQDADDALYDADAFRIITKRQPTVEEMKAMMYAWRVAKHVKSNAIVYAASDRTLGIGAGQMSRVDSAMTAARKAATAGLDLTGCAVASDAFFPFADGLLEAAEAGATAVIQPGGSIRDDEVVEAADQRNIAMALTGMRHFRH